MKHFYKYKWVLQRITALLLIPLSFWFIYQCITLQNYNYLEIKFFFKSIFNSFFFLIMMLTMLFHSKIGLETIIEDYVSEKNLQIFYKRIINFISIISYLLVIVAIIKLNIF